MHLLFWISIFLYSGTSLILSSSLKSPAITEKLNTRHASKILTCEAFSPPVDLFWTDPNGKRIEYSPTNHIFSVRNKDQVSLIVHKLTNNEEGEYTCNSYEEPGQHLQNIYYLATSDGPPEFDASSENIAVAKGSDTEILCQAKGDPEPTYTWYNHLGEEVVESEGALSIKKVEGGLILSIKKISPDLEGLYSCSAHNSHGVVSKIFNVSVISTQENDTTSIYEVTVVEVTDSSVTFDIQVEGKTASDSEVYVRYNDSTNETNASWQPGDKWEIKDLIASGKYDFRFRVGENEGWSQPIRVVLLPAMPDVIIESLEGGNFVVDFNRKFDDFSRGTIDKYRVTYATIYMTGGNAWHVRECNMTVEIPQCVGSKYLIAGLSNQIYYLVTVEAHTSAGYGKPYMQKIYVKR